MSIPCIVSKVVSAALPQLESLTCFGRKAESDKTFTQDLHNTASSAIFVLTQYYFVLYKVLGV